MGLLSLAFFTQVLWSKGHMPCDRRLLEGFDLLVGVVYFSRSEESSSKVLVKLMKTGSRLSRSAFN